MLIPDSFIQELHSKVDIVELIHSRLPLKKMGGNYIGLCPFHQEKTPSFSVSSAKQRYHCFGCGTGGDSIQFLEAYDNLSFIEAVTKLADWAGMKIPTTPLALQKQEKTKPIYDMLAQATQYYQKQLLDNASRQTAIQYLKNRDLIGKNVKHFQIGFAPNQWDNLSQLFPDRAILLQAGLVIQHDSGKYYDRFRHRIIFPIRDRIGRVVGFGGRVLDDSKPKYLNSPETAVFHKQQILYGLYEYLLSKQKTPTAIIVEGYMDVVILHQFGFYSAMATMGTAFGEGHVKTLFGLFSEVCFCFDGDEAGQQAAWKALQILLPHMEDGRIIKFIMLPKGQDPDDFVRKEGPAAFGALVLNAQPLSEFLFTQLRVQYPATSIDSRASFAQAIKRFLEKLPRGSFKEMMFQKLSHEMRYSPPILAKSSEQGQKKWSTYYEKNKSPYQGIVAPLPPQSIKPNELAWYLLAEHPEALAAVLPKEMDLTYLERASIEWGPQIASRVRQLNTNISLTEQNKLELNAAFSGLSSKQGIYHRFKERLDLIPKNGVAEEFAGAIKAILQQARKHIAEQLLKKAHIGELSLEEKEQLKIILSRGGIY